MLAFSLMGCAAGLFLQALASETIQYTHTLNNTYAWLQYNHANSPLTDKTNWRMNDYGENAAELGTEYFVTTANEQQDSFTFNFVGSSFCISGSSRPDVPATGYVWGKEFQRAATIDMVRRKNGAWCGDLGKNGDHRIEIQGMTSISWIKFTTVLTVPRGTTASEIQTRYDTVGYKTTDNPNFKIQMDLGRTPVAEVGYSVVSHVVIPANTSFVLLELGTINGSTINGDTTFTWQANDTLPGLDVDRPLNYYYSGSEVVLPTLEQIRGWGGELGGRVMVSLDPSRGYAISISTGLLSVSEANVYLRATYLGAFDYTPPAEPFATTLDTPGPSSTDSSADSSQKASGKSAGPNSVLIGVIVGIIIFVIIVLLLGFLLYRRIKRKALRPAEVVDLWDGTEDVHPSKDGAALLSHFSLSQGGSSAMSSTLSPGSYSSDSMSDVTSRSSKKRLAQTMAATQRPSASNIQEQDGGAIEFEAEGTIPPAYNPNWDKAKK